MVSFDLIKLHLNWCFDLKFVYFNFPANYVVGTHLLKSFLKGYGNLRNLILLVN